MDSVFIKIFKHGGSMKDEKDEQKDRGIYRNMDSLSLTLREITMVGKDKKWRV